MKPSQIRSLTTFALHHPRPHIVRPLAARTFSRHSTQKSTYDFDEVHQFSEEEYHDHEWRQHNHIWTKDEITDRMEHLTRHQPKTFSDHIMRNMMTGLYHSFNFISGYKHNDPTPKSIEWRLIILESFAGVPGFMGAMFRHFYSLRALKRDHGMIYTLLEEAENERMHLLVCMKMFNASLVTRSLVIAAQTTMVPFLAAIYMIKPKAVNRFVGYLEETAVDTYLNVVKHAETPGTQLHEAWNKLPAPAIAKGYWKLEDDATWVDTLKCMLADETHHRDVNHTFASLPESAQNPFIKEHMEDFELAAIRRSEQILSKALHKHIQEEALSSMRK